MSMSPHPDIPTVTVTYDQHRCFASFSFDRAVAKQYQPLLERAFIRAAAPAEDAEDTLFLVGCDDRWLRYLVTLAQTVVAIQALHKAGVLVVDKTLDEPHRDFARLEALLTSAAEGDEGNAQALAEARKQARNLGERMRDLFDDLKATADRLLGQGDAAAGQPECGGGNHA